MENDVQAFKVLKNLVYGEAVYKNEKTTIKLAARSSKHLLLLNPYIGFSSLRNFIFSPKLPYPDKYNHRCMSARG